MNDFTKAELQWISSTIQYYESDGGLNLDERPISESVYLKIQSMIDNYESDSLDSKKIAKSHLSEAASLISHAICLLGLDDE